MSSYLILKTTLPELIFEASVSSVSKLMTPLIAVMVYTNSDGSYTTNVVINGAKSVMHVGNYFSKLKSYLKSVRSRIGHSLNFKERCFRFSNSFI